MTATLTSTQLAEFRDAFNIFDTQKDGTISVDEFETVMHSLGHHPSREQLVTMFSKADTSGRGVLDFDDFFALLSPMKPNDENDLKSAFAVLDWDRTGSISPHNLAKVMQSLGEECTDTEIQEMITQADYDKDGKIDFVDFKRMMMGVNT